MRLSDLASDDAAIRGVGTAAGGDVEVAGLCGDSRRLRPGELFAALPGGRADGRAFARAAVEAGAVAVLGDAGVAEAGLPVPVVVAANPRRELALMAARFYGRQPEGIAAVTGTNGKTSVATFARQIWTALGRSAASLGTLGVQAPSAGIDRATGLTSPDPVLLHALLAELAGAGVERVVMEASSHGLHQHRLDGVRVRAAALTNLTRDHFDYHGSFDAYVAAKRRLFEELLPAGDGVAVLNADIPAFPEFARVCRERGLQVLSFGRLGDDLRLVRQEPRPDGQAVTLAIHGREHTVDTRLVGAFQGSNLLAALGLVIAGGGDPEAAVAALGAVEGAPGRMQRVAVHPSGAPVFVDYAHTPDALAQVLGALRPHTAGRLVAVFGCGGDRDPGKRPEMGRIAAELADLAFVTDDNPRTEDPAAIRRAILAACPGGVEVGDRAAAIRRALAELRAGDVLVVAGKGHETGQIINDRVLPFDDGAAVRAGLVELFGAAA